MASSTVLGGSGSYPNLLDLLEGQKAAFREEGSPALKDRLVDLGRLERLLIDQRQRLAEAVDQDFGRRSATETWAAELYMLVAEIGHVRRHLAAWMRPENVPLHWHFLTARAEIRPRPLGVVGVVGAWNYPIVLTLGPLISALAAGNRAMLKPSERSPATADLLQELLTERFPPKQVAVVTGDREVASAFARLPFDHLLFTGSPRAGRRVLTAAAANLTPVTLELGGKSPVILSPHYPLEQAARRIMAGKLLNAGQTCIAPDYLLAPRESLDEVVAALIRAVECMYPSLLENPDYTWIAQPREFERLRELLRDARAKGAKIIEINPAGEALPGRGRRLLPPTLVTQVNDDMRILHDEIFGPVLPVLPYDDLDQALDYVNRRPRPLAFYYFDERRRETRKVLDRVTAGGITINDTLFHFAQPGLPFGGTGSSGMGHYHGKHGFLTFSKQEPVMVQSRWAPACMLKPPYGRFTRLLTRLMLGR